MKSDILDSYDSLSKHAYEKILGLRDVYPMTYSDIAKLETGLKYHVPTRPVPVSIMLAVMEIEAWFLAETTHISRIHSSLTLDFIKNKLHLDLATTDLERRSHPANDLDNIYHLGGLAYNKKKSCILRTIRALDFSRLYLDLKERMTYLGKFVAELDAFF